MVGVGKGQWGGMEREGEIKEVSLLIFVSRVRGIKILVLFGFP